MKRASRTENSVRETHYDGSICCIGTSATIGKADAQSRRGCGESVRPRNPCPRCGDGTWSDAGQVRAMVHFRRARSLASAVEATTVDDDDDRDRVSYETRILISVGKAHYHGAQLIESLPFGYELLRDLKLREVNFGKSDGRGNSHLQVAGEVIGEDGFEICLDCGRVRDLRGAPIPAGKRLRHAAHCSGGRTGNRERIGHLALYREIESEAIRILLPVAEMGLDERRASFQAALELGFRRRFQGSPVHLTVRQLSEPISGSQGGHRHFLVVFDAVPGGTGYLTDLWRGGNFLDVLDRAYRALVACSCQKGARPRDGCYRCIYAYQEQWNLALISSRIAQDMLKEILDHRDEVRQVATLSEVDLDVRLESELERKFLETLEAYGGRADDAGWEQTVRGGEHVWRLRLGERIWEIVPQVELGPAQGVAVACRPDFMIRDANADASIMPVAVFCDGLAYHACPGQPRGRIEDDIRKRQAIIASGRYVVWSLTWKDLGDFIGEGSAGMVPWLFGDLDRQAFGRVADKIGLELDSGMPQRGIMAMLLGYLRDPRAQEWGKLAMSTAVAWLARAKPTLHPATADNLEHRLHEEPARFEPGPLMTENGASVLSRFESRPWAMIMSRVSAASLQSGQLADIRCILRIFDEAEGRRATNFEPSWRAFLHAWNLLQFHERAEVLSSEMLAGEPAVPAPADMPIAADGRVEYVRVTSTDASLQACLELATEEIAPLLVAVHSAGLPLPEEEEAIMAGGRVVAETEFVWPAWKIAIPLTDDDVPDLKAAGWEVIERSTAPEALIERLRAAADTERE